MRTQENRRSVPLLPHSDGLAHETAEGSHGRGVLRGFFGRLVREPLLQFLAVGAALFVAAHVVDTWKATGERRVLVDEPLLHRLTRLYQLQMGADPSPRKLRTLVDNYVRDEVLYREAVNMGLDQGDEIVRRRLIQKLEFLNHDLVQVPEPTEAQLQGYYATHPDAFAAPEAVNFSHVYFSPDHDGSSGAYHRATVALVRLGASKAKRAPEAGDRFPFQYDYAALDTTGADQVFGRSPLTAALFSVPAGHWSGPFRSGYGWHLVYISSHTVASVPPFAQERDKVREAWLNDARTEANRKTFEDIKQHYQIVLTSAAQGALQ